MSLSPIQIWPMVGRSSPATILSVVVSPHSDGPSKAKNDPRGISSSSWFTAVNVAYLFVTVVSLRSPEVSSVTDPLNPSPPPGTCACSWSPLRRSARGTRANGTGPPATGRSAGSPQRRGRSVSYTHLRAHETDSYLV